MNEFQPKIITPFGFYCQHVLPLVYDESLSYYEVLCKLQAKLNEVIETQNEIQDAFINLLNWVNEQLELYAKGQLNEWLSNGTLEDLINEVLFNRKIGYYETVSDMVSDLGLNVGNVCYTLGYYAINDGGQGVYTVREKNDEINIGNVVYLENGMIAVLQEEEKVINLNQYGIKKYDFNQPTLIYDNTPILQYAINRLGETGGLINIGCGSYAFEQTLILRPNITISGTKYSTSDNTSGTELVVLLPTQANFIEFDENDKQHGYIFIVELRNLIIVANDKTDIVIKWDCVGRSKIKNVTTRYGNIGLYVNYGMTNIYEDMYILYSKKYGLLVDNKGVPTTTQTMNKCYIGQSSAYNNSRAIYITRKACFDFTFNDCCFETVVKPSVIMCQNNVYFNNIYVENIPIENSQPCFEIGILRDESNISSGNIDNTQAPQYYELFGIVQFNGGHIQGTNGNYTFSGNNFVNAQVIDNISCNSVTFSRFNYLIETQQPSYLKGKYLFNSCVFETVNIINNADIYFKYDTYINCIDKKSNLYINDLQQTIYGRQIMHGTVSTPSWIVLGKVLQSTTYGGSFIVFIDTIYSNTPPQNIVLCFSGSNSKGAIAKINSSANTPFSKARLVQHNEELWLEIYYNENITNSFEVTCMSSSQDENKMILNKNVEVDSTVDSIIEINL